MRKILYIFIALLIFASTAQAADLVRYVNTDNTCDGDEDGTTNETDGSSDSAYCALATAEADLAQNLVTGTNTMTIKVSGTAADTTGVTIGSDWTTNSTYCLTITTDEALSNSVHSGTYPTNTYRLESDDYYHAISVDTDCLHLNGLAIASTGNDDSRAALVDWDSGTELHMTNLIGKYAPTGTPTTSGANVVIDLESNSDTGKELVVANSIFYDFEKGFFYYGNADSDEYYIYNNTIVHFDDVGLNPTLYGSSDTYSAKNNIVVGLDGSTDCYSEESTASTDGSTNNLSSDADVHGAAGLASKTVTFANAGGDDFHLSSSDSSGALGGASDLSADGAYAISDDIDGDTRSDWDIGADEEGGGSGAGQAGSKTGGNFNGNFNFGLN